MSISIVNQYGAVPPGTKFGSYQDFVAMLEKIHTSYLPGEHSPVNSGSTTPAAEDQDRPWTRRNVDGSPDRTYVFFNGNWVARHPISPGSSERRLWQGTLEALRGHDGGDGTADAPTDTVGAMWEEDIAFRDKIPMGVLAVDGSVVAVGSTSGAKTDSITLTSDNLLRHRHEITVEGVGDAEGAGEYDDATSTGYLQVGAGTETSWTTATRDVVGHTRYYGKASPDPIEVDTVPPVIGTYVIKRTSRVYFLPGA
jgi:hypothetical protein